MREPWRLVVLTTPDGVPVPTRVWLPPISGVAGEADAPHDDRQPVLLPRQAVPRQFVPRQS